MSLRLRHVLAAVAVALLAAAPATPVVASPGRHAGPNGEAVVEIGNSSYVVQVGGGIRGIDALRAVASVETLNYGGSLGEAVCKINGVGDDPQPSSCPGGWRYYRATNGASGWTYSGAGPSNTTVRGGDVEGWGYNSTPPFRPFCSVAHCAPPPPPPGQPGGAIPGGAYPPPGGGGSGSGGGGGGGAPNGGRAPGSPGAPGTPGETGVPEDPTATTAAPETTTTEGKGGSSSRAARTRLASDDSPGPGSPLSFIIFGVVLALLVAGVLVVRRARRRPATATAAAGTTSASAPGDTSDTTEPSKPTDAAT